MELADISLLSKRFQQKTPDNMIFAVALKYRMFSKIERGDRRAKRSQVIQMATYFKVDEKEMLTLWLADKVLDALEGEDELKLTAIETAKDELMDVNR